MQDIDYHAGLKKLLKEEHNLNLSSPSLLIEKQILLMEEKTKKNDTDIKKIKDELQKTLKEKTKVDIEYYPIDTDNENYIIFSGLMFNEIIFNYRYENGDIELKYSNKSPNIKTIELEGELAKIMDDFKEDFFNIINEKF